MIKVRKTYGNRRIQAELSEEGIQVGRDHIYRLRKEMNLKCIQIKKFKATTNSAHNLPIVPNILDQCFDVVEPGTVYGTDITYIPTEEGWLYLAGVKDYGTRENIGDKMEPQNQGPRIPNSASPVHESASAGGSGSRPKERHKDAIDACRSGRPPLGELSPGHFSARILES